MSVRLLVVNYVSALSDLLYSEICDRLTISYMELVDAQRPNAFDKRFVYHKTDFLHYGQYQVNWESIIPLDPSIIEKMAPYESIAMRMMDRNRKPNKIANKVNRIIDLDISSDFYVGDDLSFDERKRIYLRHLRYWNHMIETKKIDLYVATNTPHLVYDYVAYALCQLKGIKTLFFDRPHFPGTVYPRLSLEEKICIPSKSTFTSPKLSQCAQEFFNIQATRDVENTNTVGGWQVYLNPRLAKKVFYAGNVERIWKSIARGVYKTIFRLDFGAIKRELALRKNKEIFRRKSVSLDTFVTNRGHSLDVFKKEKYVYFPLHYQPESSTSPQVGFFVDQLIILDLLLSTLPDDVFVAVKEHPAQTCVARDPEFYLDLISRGQVRLMKNSVSTYDLIDGSICVCTGNGTAAWEAFYRGKPALIFGNGYQGQAPAGFSVSTLEDCENAITKVLDGDFDNSYESLLDFASRLEEGGLRIYTDDAVPEELRESGISEATSVAEIVSEIVKQLPDLALQSSV